jgi:hypothetical protein
MNSFEKHFAEQQNYNEKKSTQKLSNNFSLTPYIYIFPLFKLYINSSQLFQNIPLETFYFELTLLE